MNQNGFLAASRAAQERICMKRIAVPLFVSMLLAAVPVPSTPAAASAQERPADAADTVSVRIDRWLVLGPITSPAPVFGADEGKRLDAPALLAAEDIPPASLEPVAGRTHALLFGRTAVWRAATADTNGAAAGDPGGAPAVAYFAAYLEVPRWMKVKVSARGTGAFRLTIDGAEILKSESGSPAAAKSAEAKLERGAHLLVVKTVRMPSDTTGDWRVDASVAAAKRGDPRPSVSLSPSRPLALGDILDIATIADVALSPDGALAALTVSSRQPGSESPERRIEIRRTKDGALVRAMSDLKGVANIQWAPAGNRLSYLVRGEGSLGSIRVVDLASGEITSPVDRAKNLERYRWAPDGSFLLYSASEKREPDKRGVKHLTSIEDRWDTGGDRSFLYLSTVPGGHTRRLTAGPHGTAVEDVHPDGKRALVTRRYEDLSERPYGATEIHVVDLESGSAELLWKGGWLDGVSYSPDGRTILFEAGPSAFGTAGVTVSAGTTPNEYDGQLFLFDPATKRAEPLTRDFDPAVQRAHWSRADGNIYIVAEDRAYTGLFRCNPKTKSFRRIETGFEVSADYDFALDRSAAVFVGAGATEPPRLYAIDLAKGASRMIHDPNAGKFDGVRQGDVNAWTFTASSGKTIDGHYYLPPDFDPAGKYPCIVYYYGGTSPVDRSYGGRYPKNLWAAHGYVVYVLQPSGATGYGQEFSAGHVNDWGEIAAQEVIEGVKKFVGAHPFVDGSRLGCIGASFGGFMTQLIVTKTDMFAAAVSHAGISFIGSYWGEGYWGYSYNAVSAAGSFPWNRRDIYVDRSPLFGADRIATPLLLTHGAADTNVPPGESEQMFTALKLLGKTVEYLRFDGQNHFILERPKRELWSKSIIAWFDRFLKSEPDWWYDLYPAGKPAETAGEAAPGSAAEPALPALGATVLEKTDGAKVILGAVTREDIANGLAGWDAEYFEYRPDEAILGEIGGLLGGIEIVVVLGTWCGDSHREVPRFWKVADAVGLDPASLRMYAVESSRAKPDAVLTGKLLDWSRRVRARYGVTAVESIIVYRGGAEIGRIVEAPAVSIEADLLEILKR
jgi:dipeptidyl aminopeptidase/acylaminoacyl peptidase/thiol-disulfide isomerase/thioredoxin